MVQGRIRFKMETAQAACRPPTQLHSCKACVYVCAHVFCVGAWVCAALGP